MRKNDRVYAHKTKKTQNISHCEPDTLSPRESNDAHHRTATNQHEKDNDTYSRIQDTRQTTNNQTINQEHERHNDKRRHKGCRRRGISRQ